jgi:ligand-binding SRPBCC domain-containing protein
MYCNGRQMEASSIEAHLAVTKVWQYHLAVEAAVVLPPRPCDREGSQQQQQSIESALASLPVVSLAPRTVWTAVPHARGASAPSGVDSHSTTALLEVRSDAS